MSKPDSFWTRLRWRLTDWIEPLPDAGEAWCMGCTLNGGRTKVLAADGRDGHVRVHEESSPGETVTVITTWPARQAAGGAGDA